MKVYELASDLEVESSAVIEACIGLEIDITSHMQGLTDEQAEAVTDRLANAVADEQAEAVAEETGDEKEVAESPDPETDEDLVDDMTGVTDTMRGVQPPLPAMPKLSLEDIKILSVDVNEISDVGFDALYDNLPGLVEIYPERDQFVLSQEAKRKGNHDLGRQALRNGLVDLK